MMPPMRPRDTKPPHRATRARLLSRAVQARRRLETLPEGTGRAWINGREVGGPDLRFGHLSQTYD